MRPQVLLRRFRAKVDVETFVINTILLRKYRLIYDVDPCVMALCTLVVGYQHFGGT
jgi:hypothetical protein